MSAITVLVDGRSTDQVPATDSSVLRGDGCFEAIRVYSGSPFRLDDHFARLERSAAGLGMAAPTRADLNAWVYAVVAPGADCVVRVVLTRGPAVPGATGEGKCIVMAHPVSGHVGPLTLWPVPAPWHPAGRYWELAGVKTISYAANLSATRAAATHGAVDAVLIADSGIVLEGPTFSVGWAVEGRFKTPPLGLGILDSITRRVVRELVPEMVEAEADVEELQVADEVFVMSTVREIQPVTAVGDSWIGTGPLVADLAQRFESLVRQSGTSDQPR